MQPPPETVGGGDADNGDDSRERRLTARFLRNYKIQEVIRRRQILLVQVVKEERGTKGAALTTYLSLAGRFCVLMPNSPRGGGISRKITSAADRRRLKEIMAELDIPRGMGLIVRTAGANRPKPEIKRDCEYLLRLWDDIREHTLKSVAPALIYEEASLIKRAIRDVYSRDIDEILVDGEEGWRAAHDFMRMLMPSHAKKVQFWRDGGQPLFAKHQVEAQLDAMLSPTVQLALRRLSGDQPDRGAGRDRRQLRPLDAGAQYRGNRAAHQPGSRRRGGAAVAAARPRRADRHRLHRHGVEAPQRDGRAPDEGGAEERPRAHPDRPYQPFRAAGNEPAAAAARRWRKPASSPARIAAAPAMSAAPRTPRSMCCAASRTRAASAAPPEVVVHVATPIALYLLNHKRDRLREIEPRYAMRVVIAADDTQIAPQFRIDRVRVRSLEDFPVAVTPDRPMMVPPPELETEAEEDDVVAVEDEEDEAEDEAPADADAAPAGETAEEAERRRRRRRRRRRGGRREDGTDREPGPVVAAAEPDEDAADPVEAETADATEQAAPAEAAEGTETPGEDDPRNRRRGRRGGRRRRRDGEGEISPFAVPGAEQPELPPVYAGPTPADPFGGGAFDIFDVMDQVERQAEAAPAGRVGAFEEIENAAGPEPESTPAEVEPVPIAEAGPPAHEPESIPAEIEPTPVAEADQTPAELEPAPEPEPPKVVSDIQNATAPEPSPEPLTVAHAPVAPTPANDVAPPDEEPPPVPAILPILVGAGDEPPAEKKRGWWRR